MVVGLNKINDRTLYLAGSGETPIGVAEDAIPSLPKQQAEAAGLRPAMPAENKR